MPKSSSKIVPYTVLAVKEQAGPQFQKVLNAYCNKLEQFPHLILPAYVVLLAVIIGAGWRPLEVEIDLGAFMRADGEAAKLADCYDHALGARLEKSHRRLTDEPLNITDVQSELEFAEFELQLIYKAIEGDAMAEGPLRNIRDFEWHMRNLPGWRTICGEQVDEQSRSLCEPGESLTNYLWPSPHRSRSETASGPDGKDKLFSVRFDGRGSERIPTAMVIAYLRSFPDGDLTSKFLPKGFGGQGDFFAPALRSHFTFRFHIGSTTDSESSKLERTNAAQEIYEEFVRDTLYPLLRDPKQPEVSDSEFHIQVFYHGHYIQEYEAHQVLYGDILLSLGAFILVLAYVWMHTRSVLLSLVGLVIVFAAIPVAYIMTPASKVSIVSFFSLFVVIGIGSDFIFIFTDLWDQHNNNGVGTRLSLTISGAGKICMGSSFTTAVSFYANLASVLRPLREFGFFLGTSIVICFILIMALYPPILVLSLKSCRFCQRKTKPVVIDMSNMNNLAIMPSANDGEQLALPAAAVTSPKSRLLSNLVDFSLRWRRGMLILLCTILLVSVITISVVAEMDASTPLIFPEGHNQMEVKKMMEHFEPGLSSTGLSWNANACTPNVTDSSTCMLHWCEAPGPWDTPADECSCAIRPVSGMTKERLASCDTLDVKSRISGKNLDISGESFKRRWATHVQRVASVAVGAGSAEAPGFAFSHEGYWQKHFSKQNYTHTIEECADRCSDVEGCVAFNRIDIQGSCFLYNAEKGEKRLMPKSKNLAYTKVAEDDMLFDNSEEALFAKLSMLALEDWESGEIATHSFVEGPQAAIRLALKKLNSTERIANVTCSLEELCFCGGPVCSLPGWQKVLPKLKLNAQRRLSWVPKGFSRQELSIGGLDRALSGNPSQSPQLTVTLVHGLLPSRGGPPMFGNYENVWDFDPRFEPENPWAQRAMLNICRDIPGHLQVVEVKCWPLEFLEWLKENDKRYPSRNFHIDLMEFISDSKKSHLAQYMWIRKDQLLATKIDFNLRYSSELPGSEALDLMDRWNAFVADNNRQASVSANVAWHTSQVWVRAQAEAATKASMVDAIVISVLCSFLGMLLFTQNLLLAMSVFMIVACVICSLAFFMVAIMQWAIGAIEAISLVVFVGYSITYSMHIADIFGQRMNQTSPSQGPEVSEASVKAAVLQIGGATCGSAATTLISSFFLLFCTLQVFFRLGLTVLLVTILSVALTFLTLPAALVVVWLPGMSVYNRLISRVRPQRLAPVAPEESFNKDGAEKTCASDFETIVPGRPV